MREWRNGITERLIAEVRELAVSQHVPLPSPLASRACPLHAWARHQQVLYAGSGLPGVGGFNGYQLLRSTLIF